MQKNIQSHPFHLVEPSPLLTSTLKGVIYFYIIKQGPGCINYYSTNNSNKSAKFVPIVTYNNAETDKSKILSDNKGKAGIYQWTHIESGKIYIGSAIDLSKRLNRYYSCLELKRVDNYICRALLDHTHSAFSLAILEFIDILNLGKEETRKIILGQEQCYLNLVFSGEDKPNSYNLLPTAGSSLGYKHTKQSLAKFSGENHHMFGRTDEKNPFFGRSEETLAKMRDARGTTIYVYSTEKSTLENTFCSAREAAEYFNCGHKTIMKYVKNKNIFQKQWILSTSLITKE